MLENIFNLQKNFQHILNNHIPTTIQEIVAISNVQEITYQILSLIDEATEALRCIPWKPWKKQQNFQLENFKMELMDIFHFLVNLMLFAGMSADTVYEYFKEKNQINILRHKNGY